VQDDFTLYDGTRAVARQDALGMSVSVEHSPAARQYEVVLPMTSNPRSVTVAGKALRKLDAAGDQAGETGWNINSDDGTLHVFFPADDFTLNVTK
jgi:hypothetical protein